MAQVHLLISGRVQGVFYRMHAHKKATQLQLTGWVRNVPDGRVEIFAEGPDYKLEELVAWCQEGPPAASVENVEEKWLGGEQEYADFRITN